MPRRPPLQRALRLLLRPSPPPSSPAPRLRSRGARKRRVQDTSAWSVPAAGDWFLAMRLSDALLEVSLRITYVGGTPRSEWFEVHARARFSLPVEGRRIERSTVPDSRVPASVRQRAVWSGGMLEGVAEVGTTEQLPRLIGRWTMRAQ